MGREWSVWSTRVLAACGGLRVRATRDNKSGQVAGVQVEVAGDEL